MTEDEARKITPPFKCRSAVTLLRSESHDHDHCCAAIWGNFHSHQCTRKPKVSYGNLGYCGTHDPVKVVARNKAREDKWRKQWAAQDEAARKAKERREFQSACESAVRQIVAGHNDPRSLCADILSDYEGKGK